MARAKPGLTLFMPGLFGPVPAVRALPRPQWPDMRCLEWLLACAVSSAETPQPPEAKLFQLFHVPFAAEADPPAAAVTRLLDCGTPDDAWWLRADPVHLMVDRDAAVLAAHDALRVTPDEAARLSAELQAHFAEEGWRLEALHPARWYLAPRTVPRLHTHAIGEVLGRDVRAFLPTGEDGPLWHRYLNEVQMLLHASPVNTEREAAGKLAINSLWFWGGGRLPRTDAHRGPHWAGVRADEPLVQGLAALTGAPAAALPAGTEEWLRGEPGPGEHLIYLDDLRRCVAGGDPLEWLETLETVQARWLAPAANALVHGVLAELVLLAGDGNVYRVVRADIGSWWRRGWRAWRRRRPLSAYM